MSNPIPAPAANQDWQGWPVPTTGPWPGPQAAVSAIRWRTELTVAVLAAVYSVVLGGAVGLIWPRIAPHLQLVRAINGSEAATKSLLRDDMTLALLGIAAGLISVAVLALVARDAGNGPGGLVGLGVGGLLGSLVAAQVGHLVQHPHVMSLLVTSFPSITHHEIKVILGDFDFKVRAKAVLLAWPFAAVVMHTAIGIVRYLRNP